MRFLGTSILTLGLVVLTAVAARAEPVDLQHYVDSNGDQWLFGCATADVADNLVAHAGFQVGIGPVPILCIEGYVSIYKQLGG